MSYLLVALLAAYITGAILLGPYFLFLVCLGGKNEDLWKFPAATIFWPIVVAYHAVRILWTKQL